MIDKAPGFAVSRPCFAFAALIACLLLSGCAVQLWEEIPEPTAQALAERRGETLDGWESLVVDGTTLRSVLDRATPMIVSSTADISFQLESLSESDNESGSGEQTWRITLDWKIKTAETFGAAAVVAHDGYILTAAHVVDEPPIDLIVLVKNDDGDPHFLRSPARVVWTPDARSSEIDLAVVHASVVSLKAFSLADKTAETDDRIITGGWPVMHMPTESDRSRLSAGRVLSVTERDAEGSSPAVTILRHDAPIVHGDSGGPVLDARGHLLGVNSTISYDLNWLEWFAALLGRAPGQLDLDKFSAKAIMPDPEWLREVIENDRRLTAGNPDSP